MAPGVTAKVTVNIPVVIVCDVLVITVDIDFAPMEIPSLMIGGNIGPVGALSRWHPITMRDDNTISFFIYGVRKLLAPIILMTLVLRLILTG